MPDFFFLRLPEFYFIIKAFYHFFQCVYTKQTDSFYQCSFFGIFHRHHTGVHPLLCSLCHDGQYSMNRFYSSIQSYFSYNQKLFQPVFRNNPHCSKHCHCYRQIKGRTGFSYICRREINRNPFWWETVSTIFKGCPHPLSCLLHLCPKIAYHIKHWKSIADICLHTHKNTLDSICCSRIHFCNHCFTLSCSF